jgi:hypothetical protein
MLERHAVKVACVVLRGPGEGDLAWLPGDDSDGTETSGRRNRMDQTSTDQILHQLLEEQKRLLETLTNQRPKSKDVWDRFAALSPLISGLAVALVGAVFTGIYSSRLSAFVGAAKGGLPEAFSSAQYVPSASSSGHGGVLLWACG